MLPNTQSKTKTGDCEASHFDGAGVNCRITLTGRNMWLCDECLEKDRTLYERERAANVLVQSFRKVDESIKLDTDIHNAKTPAIVEMVASIEHDDAIPANMKVYACTKTCEKHFLDFREAVFNKRKELTELENTMRMWQVNGQSFAGKLSVDIQKEFTVFDGNYKPTIVKSTKPKAVKVAQPKESVRSQIASAKALMTQYGLDKVEGFTYDIIMMSAKGKSITLEAAAKRFAEDLL